MTRYHRVAALYAELYPGQLHGRVTAARAEVIAREAYVALSTVRKIMHDLRKAGGDPDIAAKNESQRVRTWCRKTNYKYEPKP